jgi:hypothetical protein
MVSPDSMGTACPPSGRNSTYPSVQISGTSSDSDLAIVVEVGGDGFFPSVGFISRSLLRRDVFALEILIGPPAPAFAIEHHGFREELIAI